MFYNFRTCYSTVSNMRRYRHKCHFRKIIFYSTFSLSSQYLIQCFLSLLTVFSLSDPCSLPLSSSDHLPYPQNNGTVTSPIKPPITDHPPSLSHRSTYAIVQRYSGLIDQRYAIVLHLATPISQSPISPRRSRVCGFVPVVGLGCGFMPISLVIFLFFYFLRWHWWM